MDSSTTKCYSHDQDSYPWFQGHLPSALTNWGISPLRGCVVCDGVWCVCVRVGVWVWVVGVSHGVLRVWVRSGACGDVCASLWCGCVCGSMKEAANCVTSILCLIEHPLSFPFNIMNHNNARYIQKRSQISPTWIHPTAFWTLQNNTGRYYPAACLWLSVHSGRVSWCFFFFFNQQHMDVFL